MLARFRALLSASALLRAALLYASYWLSWQAAGCFELQPNVSAIYLWPGLSVAAILIGGWRLVPLLLLIVLTVPHLEYGMALFTHINWPDGLRQVLVYGGTGLFLRARWLRMPQRLSLDAAIFVVLTATVATIASAFIALLNPPFNLIPAAERGAFLLAFWGGDFAGLMLGLPGAVLLWDWLRPRPESCSFGTSGRSPAPHSTRSILGLLAFTLGLSLLVLLLPWLSAVDADLRLLTLFAVLLGGLLHGVRIAYLIALLVCSIQLLARWHEIGPMSDILDLQMLLVMSVTLGLIAGAARDDKLHEWHLANFDPLTGLANRHRFYDRLEQGMLHASRQNSILALLYLDLDGFKAVNDRFGHAAGDSLLQQAAARMLQGVRATDTVARLGGDEFAIILNDLEETDIARNVGNKLLQLLHQPFAVNDTRIHASASIGLACWPADGSTASELIHYADSAMYEAKSRGRNCLIHRTPLNSGDDPTGTPRSHSERADSLQD